MASSHFSTGNHHLAVCHSGEQGANYKGYKDCELHPGHTDFLAVDQCLNREHPEISMYCDEDMSGLKNLIDRTVRVVARHVSDDRPDTFKNSKNAYPCAKKKGSYNYIRYGTAFLVRPYSFDEQEPCPKLKTSSPNLESYYFLLNTATHVVFDASEAQNTVFEFFYDDEYRIGVAEVYGVTVLGSRLHRLQTDMCHVVCMTHDASLAEKLCRLCDRVESLWINRILVSHPHGVSKRISFGDAPQYTYHTIIPNQKSVKLNKDTKIRFPGCHDDALLVQNINNLLDTHVPVIVFDDVSKSFVLHRDLKIYRPEGIAVDVDYDYSVDIKDRVWCDVFPPGTQLVADNGNSYTFPDKDGKVSRIRMEVFEKIEYFMNENDKDSHSVYFYSRYKMASCPGSSGARVDYIGDRIHGIIPGYVHFGDCGDYNTSSMWPKDAPADGQLECETNNSDPWPKSGQMRFCYA